MQRLNNSILYLSLRARGYNNCCEGKFSGEHHFIKLISKYNLRLVLDIGANIGSYTKHILYETKSKVISFEPQEKCMEGLNELKENFGDRLEIINKAVSNISGKMEIYYGEEGSELASLSKDVNLVNYVGESNVNFKIVDTISIDDFIANYNIASEKIDFIKIDVEGFEKEVLLGMLNLLESTPPKFIQIEFNHHHLFRGHTIYDLGKILKDYVSYQLLPAKHGLVKRDLSDRLSNIFMYSNFVFIRKDLESTFDI